ncbi:MAG: hypothetical protein IJC84_00665 [Clostridia bacterium]|nr:hypothetical protein [Clostridia bacterium]
MRGNELLEKMALIDPAYIEAAATIPSRKKIAWGKWAALAACFCIVVASALMMGRRNQADLPHTAPESLGAATQAPNTEPETSEIPTDPPFIPPWSNGNGMGHGGLLYHDISELCNGNPWNEEMDLGLLPVYKNGAYDASGVGIPKGMSEAEMRERLSSVASALRLEVLSTEVISSGTFYKDGTVEEDRTPASICAKTDFGTIHVQTDGTVTYFLPDEGLALPDGYHFTYYDTSDDEAEEVLSYFIEHYGELLNFKNPVAVSSGSYDIYGRFGRSYTIYDAADSDLEGFLNYHFRSVQFAPNDQGHLMLIRIYDGLSSAKKVGDYSIITSEEAKKHLISDSDPTDTPVAFPGEEYIEKIELVYRVGRSEELLLPYYRFYVRLPDSLNQIASKKGLKLFGSYYVLAIEDEAIATSPSF